MTRRSLSLLSTAAAAFAALALQAAPAQASVGISVDIAQPGVYGRVDIGRFPQPVLVSPQPVYVAPPVVVGGYAPRPAPEPVYMWVPPEHQRHWRSYCARYHACNTPVYFVQDRWYRDRWAAEREHGHGHAYGHDRDHGRDDHDHGHGRGH